MKDIERKIKNMPLGDLVVELMSNINYYDAELNSVRDGEEERVQKIHKKYKPYIKSMQKEVNEREKVYLGTMNMIKRNLAQRLENNK